MTEEDRRTGEVKAGEEEERFVVKHQDGGGAERRALTLPGDPRTPRWKPPQRAAIRAPCGGRCGRETKAEDAALFLRQRLPVARRLAAPALRSVNGQIFR
ncbi:hypothetical protein EYF80_064316 [Liparis tanakae]|uniref:Uncharacterized protein n=1 Tax=Liparis tanakae TaxID=230148 RepID=A0A4Z2EA13_9TELE|nr:hypothetical protein EYF80_064316 [Liparis tanakae]